LSKAKKEEKEEKKEKVKEGEIKDADLLGTDDAKLDDAQKARKGDLVKAKEVIDAEEEDKRILEAEDKDLTEEQRTKKY